MVEPNEPEHVEFLPVARPIEGMIPVARPIGQALPARARRRNEAILLLTDSTGAAWADIARLVIYLALFEVVTDCVIALAVPLPPEAFACDGDDVAAQIDRALLLPLLLLRALGSIAIIAGILRYRRQPFASVGLERSGLWMNLLIGLGAAVAVYAAMIFVMVFLWFVWPGMWRQMEENARRLTELLPRLDLLAFGGVALTVGVYEEVVFRGFLMTRLRRGTWSWVPAVIISTLMFSGLHALDQTAAALIAVTLLSLLFSMVTIWRRSIIPAIVGHTLFDWSQFLILSLQAGDSWT